MIVANPPYVSQDDFNQETCYRLLRISNSKPINTCAFALIWAQLYDLNPYASLRASKLGSRFM